MVERKHPQANCEECPLQETGRFVPSVGPEKTEIAFVGESPGKTEVYVGKPFTGPSGKLLNALLQDCGIARPQVLLTNATLCRDPTGATPTRAALQACRPRLLHELGASGATTVVALGNSAAQTLLDTSEGVTKLRVGKSKSCKDLDSTRIIPTFHPAACLRSPDYFPDVVRDFAKISESPKAWQPPEYTVYDTTDSATEALNKLYRLPEQEIVIDIETDFEKDSGFDHPNNYDLLCIGIGYADKKVMIIERNALKDPNVLRSCRLALNKHKIVAQNGKYDIAGLQPKLGMLDLYADIMLASYCLDERQGIHSLDHQAVEKLGAPSWKGQFKRHLDAAGGSYGSVDPTVLARYNAYDVCTSWDLWQLYKKQLDDQDLRGLHDFLVAASNQLVYMELNGIAIDREYNSKLTTTYINELVKLETEMCELIDNEDFNARSPLQVREVLKGLGLKIPKKLNAKREMVESTDEPTLRDLLERLDTESNAAKFIRLLLEHRREQKLYGTYVKGLSKRLYRNRVYPSFLLIGTTTGRLSCRNPNLQNIPRESSIRKQFIPAKPENVFVQVDYSQAELRVLTYLAQDEYFRNIFNDPTRDIFNELITVLYGNINHLSLAEKKERRIRAKAYVYGLAYGREAPSIADELKISIEEAKRGIETFFSVIPSIVDFRQRIQDQVLSGEDLVTPFGRKRRFWLITNENKHEVLKQALAFLPQSTSSDICLKAFTKARPRLKGRAVMRNIVHDSILAECHKDVAEEVAAKLSNYMVESAQSIVGDYVRFAVEATIGSDWGSV